MPLSRIPSYNKRGAHCEPAAMRRNHINRQTILNIPKEIILVETQSPKTAIQTTGTQPNEDSMDSNIPDLVNDTVIILRILIWSFLYSNPTLPTTRSLIMIYKNRSVPFPRLHRIPVVTGPRRDASEVCRTRADQTRFRSDFFRAVTVPGVFIGLEFRIIVEFHIQVEQQ